MRVLVVEDEPTLAAQLATAPVLAYHFCQLAPIGIAANLAAARGSAD